MSERPAGRGRPRGTALTPPPRSVFPPPCRGQVAFITGGGSGIGFRIAEIFMR